jgi:hypothetical protein
MSDPQMPTGPIPDDWEEIENEREQVLEYLTFVARAYDPDTAKIEIEKASSRLINLVAAEYEAIRRHDEENGVYAS